MLRPVAFTVEIGGPFKVQSRPYWLKAVDRKSPLCGEQVVSVQVVAGVGETQMPVEGIADGQGLAQRDTDRLLEHDVDPNHMRVTPEDVKVDYVEFDLGKAVALDLMQVWNYNATDKTQWGLKQADIAVWTAETGWQKVRQGVKFDQAEGTEDYDEPSLVRMEGMQASKVRLENLVGFEGSDRMGLSEVQFFQVRLAKAIKPAPADGGVVSSPTATGLTWTSGVDAVKQRIYMGLDANDLKLLGEVKADITDVRLSPLKAGDSRYIWRVDTVHSDGSVVAGDLWSFKTGGLVGWWKFDETEGAVAKDSSGNHYDGRLMGNPRWQPTGGKVGGALEYDGNGDYLQILNEADLDVTDQITVAAWIKVNRFHRSWQTIISKGDSAWRLQRDNNNPYLEFTCSGVDVVGAQWSDIHGKVDVNDAQWHHAVGVYDGAHISLYVDGSLDVSAQASGKINETDYSVLIGENAQHGNRFWNGLIDDVRVYACAFTESDVKALYEGRSVSGPVQASVLPHILSAAEGAQAEPIGEEGEGETTPSPETRRMIAIGPLMLIVVVVVVGILGIVLLFGRKKK